MTDINVRQSVIDAVKPLLPTDWELLPYGTTFENLDHVVCMLTMKSIARAKEAPQSGWRAYTATLTILHPNQDPSQLWGLIDDDIIDLLNAVDEVGAQHNIRWVKADYVIGNDAGNGGRNWGFDIDLEYYYRKDNTDG